MEVNQEKLNSEGKSEPWINSDQSENKENRLSDELKSDKTLLDMIKSRPKRCNRKVPSRLRPVIREEDSTATDEKKPTDLSGKSSDASLLDSGLDTFFQSTSITFKRQTFGDTSFFDEAFSRAPISDQSILNRKTSQFEANAEETEKGQEDKSSKNDDFSRTNNNKLSPLWADKVSRSRSSPNLIDPRKMLMPGDPRVNLSIIKELRTRQKTGESEVSNNKNIANNNNHHHLSLLSELKSKNKPICSKNDSAHINLVNRDKPPISILKPSLKCSSGSSTVQQSGQFFNVKLKETKSDNRSVNSLIKSYTRASFPVKEIDDVKRKSTQNCKDGDEADGDENNVTGLSKEASALDVGKDEKSSDRSSEESSSSSSDEDEKENDDCHQSKREAIGCCPDE